MPYNRKLLRPAISCAKWSLAPATYLALAVIALGLVTWWRELTSRAIAHVWAGCE